MSNNNDKLLQIIHDDVKDIKKDLVNVNITNAVQNTQLAEHIRRTENLEKRMAKLDILKWLGGVATLIAGYFKFKGGA